MQQLLLPIYPKQQPVRLLTLAVTLLLLLLGQAAHAQPTIGSFSPTSGGLGTTVTISGSGFTGATSVRFGEISATFSVNSASQITATVPRAASTQVINVTTTAGSEITATPFATTRNSSLTYTLVNSNFAGVSVGSNAAPAVGDLDANGRLDLLVGRADGTVGRYEQTALNGSTFTYVGLLATSGGTIDRGTDATVAFVDTDSNGKFNVLLGAADGLVYDYEQTAVGSATFVLINSSLGSISTTSNSAPSVTNLDGDGRLELVTGKGDGIVSYAEQNARNDENFTIRNTNYLTLTSNTAPFSVDLDGNSRVDVLIGVAGGNIYRFEQDAANSTNLTQITSNFNGISAGSNAKPCVTDLDGDGLLDLLVGRGDGTIDHYEQVLPNSAPTDISLSASTVAENQPVNTAVGSLSTTDPDAGNTFTYSFATGGADNASFNISGNTLRTSAAFDYETKSSYSVKIRSTDQGGLFFEKTFTISVTNVAEVPTVTSFNPTSGAVGQSVVITGTHFSDAGAATVRFNGTIATTRTVDSNTQITATVPSGATTGTISVQNADGTGTSSGTFTVLGAPNTTIVSGPPVVGNSSTVSFVFSSDQSPVDYTTSGAPNATYTGNGPNSNFGPVPDGTYTLSVAAHNTSTGLTDQSPATYNFTIDTQRPVPTISSSVGGSGTSTATAPVPFTVTFSEPVTGFSLADLTVSGGTKGNFVAVSATQYTFTVTPTVPATITVNVAASVAQDAATNQNTAATQFNIQYAPAAPNTTIVSGPPTVGNNSTVSFQFSSDQSPVDYTTSGAPNATYTGNGPNSNFGPIPDGTYTLSAAAHNTSTGLTDQSPATYNFTIDTQRPSVVVTSTAGSSGGSTPTSPIPFTITFSEAVTGFDVPDVTVTGGTFTANAVSGSVYNVVVTPSGPGSVVTVRVAASVATDAANNPNTASNTYSLTYAPAPVVSSLTPSSGPVGTTVVIAGSNFTGATAVSFGGTAASSFVVNSSSQITAVVAVGTTTGPFTVTTPYGVSNNNGTFTVTAANTSTTLTSSVNPSVFGQGVTITATVSNTNGSATPSGTVTFKDGSTTITTGTLNASGVASFSSSGFTVGTHPLTVSFAATTSFNASTSATLNQVVNAASTTTTLTSSANPSVFGQSVTFTATVAAVGPGSGTPFGTVTFRDGSTSIGTASLNGIGVATFSTSALAVGGHPITAAYGASTNYAASTSATLTQTVNNAATSSSLSSSLNPSTFGQSVTFTATVVVTSPGAGTVAGTVTFKDGSTTLGTGTISGSTATFSTSALTQGSHSITAVYGGAAGLATSTSAVLTQVVNAPPTPAITTLSPNSGPVGTSVVISGSNLTGATSVSFDGVAQTTITGNTGSSLTVAVPAGVALGSTDVVVTTPSGTSNVLTFTVTPPAPVVTSVTGPANGTYRIGQNLDFAVNFDQAVTVTGTPTITVTVGSTARTASYFSGSASTTLVFRYTVVSPDLDTDGVTLGSSIALNGGTLKNATNTNATLTLNNVASLTGVRVDGVAPTATVATTGPNPTTSSVIPITITFSETVTGLTAANVVVTNGTKGTLSGSGTTYTLNVTATASGAVTIKVNASAAQDAAGNPNVVSNTLSVNYTPPPVSITSFTPTNGAVGTVVVITGNGFTGATGVTINNVAVAGYTVDSNTQITATVAAANTTGLIRVTTGAGTGTSGTNFVVGPAITGVTATANGLYHAGQTLTFSVAFSQAVTVTGAPTVALTVGSTVRNVAYFSGSGSTTLQFRYTIVAGDLDTDGVTLSGTGIDLNGGTIRNASATNSDLDFDNVADTSGLLVDAVAPTVAIISTAGSSTPTSPIPVTITFSEPVTGFATASITVTNGSKGTLSGSGTTYTISITPTAQGAVTVDVAANAAQDAATNGNVAAPQFTITFSPPPTITSFSPANGPVGTSVTIIGTNFLGTTAVAFNGVAATSFVVNSATSITAVVPVGVTTGRVTVTTPAGTATSTGSYTFTPGTPNVLSVAVPANDTYGVGQNLDFGVVYDQAVTVTGTPRLTLTVGSTARNVAYVSGSGTRTLVFRYVVAASETDFDGVVLGGTIALNGGTIRNAGGVAASLTLNSVAPTTGVLVDGVVPTVVLSSTATSPTNTSPIPVTITFSKPVTGLNLSGLTVGNGTASNLTGSGSTYTVSITPATDGLVTVDLAATSAQDVAGNDNTAASQFSITYTAPTVVVSTLTPNSGTVGTSVTIAGSNFTGATAVTFNGTTAVFAVTNGSTITTTVPAGASTGNVVVTAPIGTSNGVPFTVTLPGTSTTLTSSVNPSALGQAITFTATVAPVTGSVTPMGTVTFSDGATVLGTSPLNASGVATFSTSSLGAGSHSITAVYGGSGTFAGSTSAVLTQVVNAPTIAAPVVTSVTGPANATYGIGAALNFSVNFDQPVTVTGAPSLTVTVGSTDYSASYVSGGGSSTLVFRYTVAASDLDPDGVMLDTSLDLNGGTIQNASGTDAILTLNNVALLTGVLVDGIAPVVAVTSPASNPTSSSPIPVTLTFSKPVTGLTLAGLTVTNGTAGSLMGSGTTYTLSITPTAGGLVMVDVAANAAHDAAGNGNMAAPQFSITYVVPPVPTITSLSTGAELPGMSITIVGTDFTSNSAVSFGGVMASSIVYNSATSLTVVVPAGAAVGSSTITVTTPAGSSSNAPSFAVLAVYTGGAPDACATAVPVTTSINDGQWHYLLSAGGQVVLAYSHTGSDLGDLSVDVLRANPANPVRQDAYGHRYLDRNFHLTASNGTFNGLTTQLRFYGLTSEFSRLQAADASVTYATLKVNQYSGPNEDCSFSNDDFTTGELRSLPAPGSTPGNGVNWFVAQTTVADHFSEFYLTGSSTPLPVELVAFTAEAKGAAVQLIWRTASEKNSARFEIERSLDGKAFTRIGEVAAQGTKTSPTDYAHLDNQLPKPLTPQAPIYYRLRQVDADGTSSYSPLRSVTVGSKELFTLYPNPAQSTTTVAGLPAGATVVVFDAVGRTVAQATAKADGTARLTLPVGLATGMYLVRSGTQTLRLAVE